jgi:hypothetical protein
VEESADEIHVAVESSTGLPTLRPVNVHVALCPCIAIRAYGLNGAMTALEVGCQSTAKGPAMKTLDEMTLGELRAIEAERFGQYEDQYSHAGPDAAKRVRYFEIVAEIYNKLRRELDRGLVDYPTSGGMEEPNQTNGFRAHADLHAVAVPG